MLKTKRGSPIFGCILVTIIAIVGAVVGGYLGQRFFAVGIIGFNLTSLMVAVAGSLLVLFVGRLVMRG